MPSNMVKSHADEQHWEEAKKAAAKEGKATNWAYVTSIFQKIRGKRGKKREIAYEERKEYAGKDLAEAARRRLKKMRGE